MDLDWKDLAQTVIGLGAPMLGTALGGPLGGLAGKILADAIGASVATPSAVNDAITERGPTSAFAMEAALKAESEWQRALAEIGKAQVSEIGQTQRAEIASGDPLQRWWRPLYALELSLVECPAFALVLLHAIWTGHDAGINGLANLSGLLMTYFGARFGVLGVYVSGRSREKEAHLTGEFAPGVVNKMVKALVKKK
jgi:hypothetical protein